MSVKRQVASTRSKTALGIGRGEQQAHGHALRDPEQRRSFGPRRIHYCADVVHPGLQVGQVGDAVGQTGSPLVEEDEPGEGGDSPECVLHEGVAGLVVEVRHPAGHQDQVRPEPATV